MCGVCVWGEGLSFTLLSLKKCSLVSSYIDTINLQGQEGSKKGTVI